MGMFDLLVIEQDIEDLPELSKNHTPQTKSFERVMAKYIIRDDKLYRRFETWRDTDVVTHKIGDIEIYERELVSSHDGQYEYHGDIHFIAHVKKTNQWERFVARFTEGELQWIIPESEYIQTYREDDI